MQMRALAVAFAAVAVAIGAGTARGDTMHPVLGAKLAGFWGVFLAVPVAGIANIFLRYSYELAAGRRTRVQAATLIEDREARAAGQ